MAARAAVGHPDEVLGELRFRAMGSAAHVAVVGGDDSHLALAEARIRELEARWSRFVDSSEVSGLNRSAGQPVIVSPDTFDLVRRAVWAWEQTGGRFDPTVGAALVAHGYDRDFRSVVSAPPITGPTAVGPTPGAGAIDLLAEINAVTLPSGVSFDAGGIGKGLAADLTAELVVAHGAAGAMVNLGGDLRALGRGPSEEGWVVTVPDPLADDAELLRLAIPEGAVATSSRLRRRWPTTTGEAHHLIDPATGAPTATEVVAVTVVAGAAWWAEALTKALFIGGPALLAELTDVQTVVVSADGSRRASPGLAATLR